MTVALGSTILRHSRRPCDCRPGSPVAASPAHRGDRLRAPARRGRWLNPRCEAHRRGSEPTPRRQFARPVDDELGDKATQADLRVSVGLAGRVIIDPGRQTNAQLAVLAARPGKPAMPGTVSQYVVLKARCPVTIVPVEGRDEKAIGDS